MRSRMGWKGRSGK